MSLTYAFNEQKEKIHIRDYVKNTAIYSPLGKQLVAKKGNIKIHHYAHKYAADRDSWLDPQMTAWHWSYQEICNRNNIEYRIEKNDVLHIADIYNDGLIIELQHSPIDDKTIKERESFYNNMIWLFDYTNQKGTILFDADQLLKIKTIQKHTTKPTFYDVGTHILRFLAPSNDHCFWCLKLTYDEFLQRYFSGIQIHKYFPSNISPLTNSKRTHKLKFDYNPHLYNDGDLLTISENECIENIFNNKAELTNNFPIVILTTKGIQTIKTYLTAKQIILILFECNNFIKVAWNDLTFNQSRTLYYDSGSTIYEFYGIEKNYVWLAKHNRNKFMLKCNRYHHDALFLSLISLKESDTIYKCSLNLTADHEKHLFINDPKTFDMKDSLKEHFSWINKIWTIKLSVGNNTISIYDLYTSSFKNLNMNIPE
ncbi:MAG: hypothetical protein Hyperionvirus25_8 [Hyperionvirus sp.]|uniref:Uncharacterized protein n=1 Tax=Hyperionvirus sp. TaxID=2487770 RepID=A0A3G5ABC4_9VIRU|nr:MAG: hypothetical protein Hyperionvirus25_8 [Hyperionvirus sp.]